MQYMSSIFFKCLAVLLLVVGLTGCGAIKNISDGKPLLFNASGAKEQSDLQARIRVIEEANDREAARNKWIQEKMSSSDQLCDAYINSMLQNSEAWQLSEKHNDELDKNLQLAISLRKFDRADSDALLFARGDEKKLENPIALSLAKTIERTRRMARIQMKARLEGSFAQYSVKQALMDVAAYHGSCSTKFAATELARSTTMAMSPEQKSESIASLMQLRQKLMDEGLNTRSVQQKIDAVILAH